MQNSQLQQDSAGATQSLQTGIDLKLILQFISEIKPEVAQLGLNPESASELETEISTIEIQSKSPKPKSSIIVESLKSIRSILEGAAGNVAASTFLSQIASLF